MNNLAFSANGPAAPLLMPVPSDALDTVQAAVSPVRVVTLVDSDRVSWDEPASNADRLSGAVLNGHANTFHAVSDAIRPRLASLIHRLVMLESQSAMTDELEKCRADATEALRVLDEISCTLQKLEDERGSHGTDYDVRAMINTLLYARTIDDPLLDIEIIDRFNGNPFRLDSGRSRVVSKMFQLILDHLATGREHGGAWNVELDESACGTGLDIRVGYSASHSPLGVANMEISEALSAAEILVSMLGGTLEITASNSIRCYLPRPGSVSLRVAS